MADEQTTIRQEITSQMLITMGPFGLRGRLWLAFFGAVVGWGIHSYTRQLTQGLEVTAMRDYVSWGMYISNFVFFIGISHAGTLISAILRVTQAEWRRPITRMAEAITVFALVVGASMVVIDMGRPERLHHVFLYGRMQSPILWDVCSITTYLVGSLLYLYVAMIPDLTLIAQATAQQGKLLRSKLYRFLSLGYRETPQQARRLNIALVTMAVIIIPVAVSVHTVVSWVFAMTLRPGWHSTIFGPYFVIGAIYSGTAAIILAMAFFRRHYRLQKHLTDACFRKLGTLLLALSLIYAYFTLCEYLTAWYGGLETEARLLRLLMGHGQYAQLFWSMAIIGMILPPILLAIPIKKCVPLIVIASILVNIGMWLKRYLIVVPTLKTPFIPPEAAGADISYFPSPVEWSITLAALAFFVILFMLFSKLFPIVSITEIAEPLEEAEKEANKRSLHALRRLPRPNTSVVLIAIASAAILGGASSAWAVQEETAKPVPQISISKLVEDDQTYIAAEVTIDGEAVEGVEVSFGIVRLFGELGLGTEETWDDGTAAVEFPEGLPGNATGELEVIATIAATDEYASASARTVLPGGEIMQQIDEPMPAALWSSRPLWPLIAVLVAILAGVWSIYIFVITMLVKIAKEEPAA